MIDEIINYNDTSTSNETERENDKIAFSHTSNYGWKLSGIVAVWCKNRIKEISYMNQI